MTDWIYQFPDPVIILISIVTGIVAMLVVHAVCHAIIGKRVPKEGFKFAETIHNSMISLFTLVLAFSLVQAIGNYRQANTEVATEAAHINNLDRLLTRFNSPKAAEVRQHLMAYTKSIIEDDWPALVRGSASETTTDLFKPISQGIIAIQPDNDRQVSLYASAVNLAQELERIREVRLESGTLQIPSNYWMVIFFAILAKMLLSALLDRSAAGTYVLSVQMAVLGALLGLVLIFDEPYKGRTSVKPDNFISVLEKMRDRKN